MRSNHWNTILSGRQIGQKVNSLVANQLLRSPFDVHAEKSTSPTPTLRHATHTHTYTDNHTRTRSHTQAHTQAHTHTHAPAPPIWNFFIIVVGGVASIGIQVASEVSWHERCRLRFIFFPQTIPIAASDLVVRSSLDAIFTSSFDPLTTRWLNLAQPNFDKTSNGLFEGWTFRLQL